MSSLRPTVPLLYSTTPYESSVVGHPQWRLFSGHPSPLRFLVFSVLGPFTTFLKDCQIPVTYRLLEFTVTVCFESLIQNKRIITYSVLLRGGTQEVGSTSWSTMTSYRKGTVTVFLLPREGWRVRVPFGDEHGSVDNWVAGLVQCSVSGHSSPLTHVKRKHHPYGVVSPSPILCHSPLLVPG